MVRVPITVYNNEETAMPPKSEGLELLTASFSRHGRERERERAQEEFWAEHGARTRSYRVVNNGNGQQGKVKAYAKSNEWAE